MIFAITPPQIEQVILRIEADADGKPALMLKKHGGAKVMKDIRFAAPVAYGKDVAVTVRWHPDGRIDVTATVGCTSSMPLSEDSRRCRIHRPGRQGQYFQSAHRLRKAAARPRRAPGRLAIAPRLYNSARDGARGGKLVGLRLMEGTRACASRFRFSRPVC